MLRIVELLIDCGISRRDLRRLTGVNRDRFTKTFLHERFPVPPQGDADAFRKSIEDVIAWRPVCMDWLKRRNLPLEAIWESIGEAKHLQGRYPDGHGAKVHRRQHITLGDPRRIKAREDRIMIHGETLKTFGLFYDPFAMDFDTEEAAFLGQEQRFLYDMMFEAGRNSGFVALIGECGTGKSIMCFRAVRKLEKERVKIIYPDMNVSGPDDITAKTLIEAVVLANDEVPKRSIESMSRQARIILQNRRDHGLRQCLILDDAHLLSGKTLKALKRLHEIGDRSRRLLGIILIGQTELKQLLDEGRHPELRETIRRITICEIMDLGNEVEPYLRHVFKRAGGRKFDDIFSPDIFQAVAQRLPGEAYPLSVNNLIAAAMNLAAATGHAKVTAEVVLKA